MKKVLIVSEYFYPNNNIGARRPTKMAKKLHERGYKVDVFTRYHVEDTEGLCDNVFGLQVFKNGVSNNTSAKKTHGRLYNAAYRVFLQIKTLRNARFVLKKFKKALAENDILKSTRYDAVFSSFGPLSSLLCGMYYKKTHRDTKWICDFRDPVIVKFIPKIWQPLFRTYEKTACKHADAVVAVSNGYLERICRGKYKEKSFMIPNGYDMDDMSFAADVTLPKEFMLITYVGALYKGSRDLSPLFKALSDLIGAGEIDADKIKIAYAGNECGVLKGQAAKYGMDGLVEDHGLLSGTDCLKLQFSSHLLLLSTWNEKKEYGVFPGKLLEYMLIGRPIISITNGDMPNGEVSTVIREGDFGFAYETARDSADYKPLKRYIKDCYDQWMTDGKIAFMPKKEVLERYDYKTVIKQVEALING